MHPIKKLGIATSILTLLAPMAALAVQDTGLGATAGAAGLDTSSSIQIVIGTVIKGALGLVGVVFLLLMVYAGYMWMIARGDEGKVETAKDTITRAVIGLVIVIGAYALTSFLINAFTKQPTTAPTAPTTKTCPPCGSGFVCNTQTGQCDQTAFQ